MADRDRFDTMMNPPIEELLERSTRSSAWSRWRAAGPPDQLATSASSATASARDRAAAGHLGGPQAAVDRLRGDRGRQDRRRRPIPSADDGRRGRAPTDVGRPAEHVGRSVHARRATHRPRGHRRHRRLQGRRGLPPPGRRRRPRRPGHDRRAPCASSARTTFSALASEPVQTSLWDEARPDPAHPARPERRPGPRAPGHRPAARRLRRRDLRRPAHRHAARHPGPGRGLPGDAHRDVGAPGGAGQPGHAAPPRRARASSPSRGPPRRRRRRRRPPGRARARSSPPSSGVLGAAATWPASACSSPPAAPASRSTPCGSSPTARRASRATPSPTRPRRRGAKVTLVTTVDRPVPAGVEVVAVETAAEMEAAVGAARRRRRRGRHGRRRRRLPAGRAWPTTSSRRPTASPRSCSSPPPTSSPASARAKPPGQMLVGFAAETDDVRANAAAKLRAQGPRPHRRQRRRRPPASASSTTPTRCVILAAPRRATHDVALDRQASGRPSASSTPSSSERRPQLSHRRAPPDPHTEQEHTVTSWTFTSESVTEGHPDKMADQISDSVLDAILAAGPDGRVACETLRHHRPVPSSPARSPPPPTSTSRKIVRETINGIGYDRESFGFDGNTCGVMVAHRRAVARHRPGRRRLRRGPHAARPARTCSTSRAPATRG